MTDLEKMARAICQVEGVYGPDERCADGTLMWTDYVDAARAALRAIREPSEGMIAVGEDSNGWLTVSAKSAWSAMIDHILSEKPDGSLADVARETASS